MKLKVGQVYDRNAYNHKWVIANLSEGIVNFVVCCMDGKVCKSPECNPYNGYATKYNTFQRHVGLATFELLLNKQKEAYKLNTYETFKNLAELAKTS